LHKGPLSSDMEFALFLEKVKLSLKQEKDNVTFSIFVLID